MTQNQDLSVEDQLCARWPKILSTPAMTSLTVFCMENPRAREQFAKGELVLLSSTGEADSWVLVSPSTPWQEALVSLRNMAPG